MKVGDRVRIQRDEKKYPPKGTWFAFRGRTGTLVAINRSGGGRWEYGVVFTNHPKRFADGGWKHPTWFKAYELCEAGSQRPVGERK